MPYWYNYDVERVDGIGGGRAPLLHAVGISTVGQLWERRKQLGIRFKPWLRDTLGISQQINQTVARVDAYLAGLRM